MIIFSFINYGQEDMFNVILNVMFKIVQRNCFAVLLV